jgi:hypothetical protein
MPSKPKKQDVDSNSTKPGKTVDAGAIMLELYRSLPPAYSCSFILDGCKVTMVRLARTRKSRAKPR